MEPRKKQLIILVSVGICIFLAVLGYFTFQRVTTGVLSITVVPKDSKVSVDNAPLVLSNGVGTVRLKKGTYTLNIEREGFEKSSQKVSITPRKTTEQSVLLTPNGSAAQDYFSKNPDDAIPYEAQSGREYQEAVDKMIETYPFVSLLPYTSPRFTISYGPSEKAPDDPTKITIYISYVDDKADFEARNWLLAQGADIDNLEIISESGNLQ